MGEVALEVALRKRLDDRRKVFVPYVTGGLAGVDAELLHEIEACGADALEIGVPFSDPIMDGGVIQEASRRALENGFHVRDVFGLVAEAKLGIPVLLMTYLNPIVAMSLEEFVRAAEVAGAAGFIVPDLPVDEGGDWTALCAESGLASVYLAAPGTSEERLAQVVDSSTGFVYCVSTYGVTGQRVSLADSSRQLVEALRLLTARPLLVGVGISTAEQAAEAATFADGVIVGSALVAPLLEGDRRGALAAARSFRAALT